MVDGDNRNLPNNVKIIEKDSRTLINPSHTMLDVYRDTSLIMIINTRRSTYTRLTFSYSFFSSHIICKNSKDKYLMQMILNIIC